MQLRVLIPILADLHDSDTSLTASLPPEPVSNAKMTSVCAGHRLGGAPAGIEPATPSLPWNHQEPLCGPPFAQVTPDRRGRSYGFSFQ
jgi:hypothetical protein